MTAFPTLRLSSYPPPALRVPKLTHSAVSQPAAAPSPHPPIPRPSHGPASECRSGQAGSREMPSAPHLPFPRLPIQYPLPGRDTHLCPAVFGPAPRPDIRRQRRPPCLHFELHCHGLGKRLHGLFCLFRGHLGGRHNPLLCQPRIRSPEHYRGHGQGPARGQGQVSAHHHLP